MMQNPICQRDGCGQTATKPLHFAGHGGTSYVIYLCEKHMDDFLKCLQIMETDREVLWFLFKEFQGCLKGFFDVLDKYGRGERWRP